MLLAVEAGAVNECSGFLPQGGFSVVLSRVVVSRRVSSRRVPSRRVPSSRVRSSRVRSSRVRSSRVPSQRVPLRRVPPRRVPCLGSHHQGGYRRGGYGSCCQGRCAFLKKVKAHQPRFGSRFCSWPVEPSRELMALGLSVPHGRGPGLHSLSKVRSGFAPYSVGRPGLGSLLALQVDLVSRSVGRSVGWQYDASVGSGSLQME